MPQPVDAVPSPPARRRTVGGGIALLAAASAIAWGISRFGADGRSTLQADSGRANLSTVAASQPDRPNVGRAEPGARPPPPPVPALPGPLPPPAPVGEAGSAAPGRDYTASLSRLRSLTDLDVPVTDSLQAAVAFVGELLRESLPDSVRIEVVYHGVEAKFLLGEDRAACEDLRSVHRPAIATGHFRRPIEALIERSCPGSAR
jgi:hypothetical protein